MKKMTIIMIFVSSYCGVAVQTAAVVTVVWLCRRLQYLLWCGCADGCSSYCGVAVQTAAVVTVVWLYRWLQ